MKNRLVPFLLFALLSAANVFSQGLDTAFLYRIGNSADPALSLAIANVEAQNRPVMRATADQPTQFWKVKKDKYGNFNLVNFRLGPAFQVELVNDTNKENLLLSEVKNLASQAWRIVSNGNGTYRISSLWIGPEKALEASLPGDGKITELKLVATTKASNQMWTFTRLPKPQVTVPLVQPATQQTQAQAITIDPTAFYRISSQWQGEARPLALEGATPKLKPQSDDRSQFWKLIPSGNGFYRITNEGAPGQCLDVVNDGRANNKLTVAPISNYSGQFWKLSPDASGNFYRLTSQWQGDGKSIDIINTGNKDEVVLNASGNYSGQFWKLTATALPPPVQAPISNPAPVDAVRSMLLGGEELRPTMKLFSPDGQFFLSQQTDGNLVLYTTAYKAIWSAGTWGKKVTRCAMQTDGNLVLYDAGNNPLWASNTSGNEGAYAVLENTGTLVIYSKYRQKLWASGN